MSKMAGIGAVIFALISHPALACVGCREPGSLTLQHENSTVLAGMAFSWSVMFMLGFVMLIVFGMSLYIWRTCRRLDQKQNRR